MRYRRYKRILRETLRRVGRHVGAAAGPLRGGVRAGRRFFAPVRGAGPVLRFDHGRAPAAEADVEEIASALRELRDRAA